MKLFMLMFLLLISCQTNKKKEAAVNQKIETVDKQDSEHKPDTTPSSEHEDSQRPPSADAPPSAPEHHSADAPPSAPEHHSADAPPSAPEHSTNLEHPTAPEHSSADNEKPKLPEHEHVNKEMEKNSLHLIDLIYKKDMVAIKKQLKKHLDVNYESPLGDTALIVAAFKDNLELTNILLDLKADANYRNRYGKRAFDYAKSGDQLDVAEALKAKMGKVSFLTPEEEEYTTMKPYNHIKEFSPDEKNIVSLCVFNKILSEQELKDDCHDKEIFDLRYFNLTEVKFLEDFPHLKYLNLVGNPITDLSPLAHREDIEMFYADVTKELMDESKCPTHGTTKINRFCAEIRKGNPKRFFVKAENVVSSYLHNIPSDYQIIQEVDAHQHVLKTNADIGRGRIGIVYMGENKLNHEHLVIKLLNEDFTNGSFKEKMGYLKEEENDANFYFKEFKNNLPTINYEGVVLKKLVTGKNLMYYLAEGQLFNGSTESNYMLKKLHDLYSVYALRLTYGEDFHTNNIMYDEAAHDWLIVDLSEPKVFKNAKGFFDYVIYYVYELSNPNNPYDPNHRNYSLTALSDIHQFLSIPLMNFIKSLPGFTK
jgi:hypothetical protein